jgi:hypothetical protein
VIDNELKKKEEEIQTASGVIESQSQDREHRENEQAQSFRRGGRKGRSGAARLGDESEIPGHARVIISQESSRCLDDLINKVNDGFDAGKVTRPQILGWVLRRFAELAGDDEIKELRAAHFDRIAYFEALLRRAKETGVLPPELNAAIQMPCGPAHAAKKGKRALTKNTINDDTTNDSKSA